MLSFEITTCFYTFFIIIFRENSTQCKPHSWTFYILLSISLHQSTYASIHMLSGTRRKNIKRQIFALEHYSTEPWNCSVNWGWRTSGSHWVWALQNRANIPVRTGDSHPHLVELWISPKRHMAQPLLAESSWALNVTWTQQTDLPISLLCPWQPHLYYLLQPSKHSPSSDLPLVPPGEMITFTAAACGDISQSSKTEAQVRRGEKQCTVLLP